MAGSTMLRPCGPQELGYRHVTNLTRALRFGRRYEVRGWHRFMMLRSTLLAFERLSPLQVWWWCVRVVPV